MPGGNGCQRQGGFELRKCYIPVIPALGRLKQGGFNFEATEQEFVSKIRETEGKEKEREDRNLGRWFSGKEHPCKLKAQHPWKSQARSWAPITAVPSGAKAGGLLATAQHQGQQKILSQRNKVGSDSTGPPGSSCAPSLCAYVLKDEGWAIRKSTPDGSS